MPFDAAVVKTLSRGARRTSVEGDSEPTRAVRRRELRRRRDVKQVNTRIAREAEARRLVHRSFNEDLVEVFCACGRRNCDDIITLSLDAYNRVRWHVHLALVSPGHEMEIDNVLEKQDGYNIVQIQRPHQLRPKVEQLGAEAEPGEP
jgi:hypothetical protein